MDNIMTDKLITEVEELKYYLLDTCNSLEAGVEALDLDPHIDWEDLMLSANIETCKGCDWWHESGSLIDEEDKNIGYCEDCREDNKDGT